MKLKSIYPYDGLVWEVPLAQNLGYAYVHTIDPRQMEGGFPSFIMKILDLRREEPLIKFDVDQFQQLDMLTSHLFFMGKPPQRKGDNRWKAIGYLPITPFDRIIPESKMLDYDDFSWDDEEIPSHEVWQVYFQGSLADYYDQMATYEQVKHLGWLTHFNVASLHHRITMEWMRKLGLDYNQYFTKQWSSDFLRTQKYQVKTTILLSGINPAIRGKAIGNFTCKR